MPLDSKKERILAASRRGRTCVCESTVMRGGGDTGLGG